MIHRIGDAPHRRKRHACELTIHVSKDSCECNVKSIEVSTEVSHSASERKNAGTVCLGTSSRTARLHEDFSGQYFTF